MINLKNVGHTYHRRSLWDRLSLAPEPVPAVASVNLSIMRGETLCLVGESGSGKSTIGRIVAGLITPSSGHVDGAPEVRMVFQDHSGSLNPRRRVGAVLADAIPKADQRTVADLLREVGLPADIASRYPAEMSGGQRQRVALARAIAAKPDLIVLDEPTSALDASTQAEILGLLEDLKIRTGLSYLLITHDLGVAVRMADRIAVIRAGRVIEEGSPTQMLTANGATHPYVRALVRAWQRLTPPIPVEAARSGLAPRAA